MRPVILMRASLAEERELVAAKKHFDVIHLREHAHRDDLVVGRYSVLPFYKEQEEGLAVAGARLINTYTQHRCIADIMGWYDLLDGLTPQTWWRAEDVPMDEPGSFVVKGETNSRKQLWRTHMFAPTRADVGRVMSRLMDDELVGSQRIYIRRFVDLVKFGEAINGLPVTNEWRTFILDGTIVGQGFYWSEHIDDLNDAGVHPMPPPTAFMDDIIKRIGAIARFVVVDVGQLVSGDWTVIELNDGQMSGLSCVDPDELCASMRALLL